MKCHAGPGQRIGQISEESKVEYSPPTSDFLEMKGLTKKGKFPLANGP